MPTVPSRSYTTYVVEPRGNNSPSIRNTHAPASPYAPQYASEPQPHYSLRVMAPSYPSSSPSAHYPAPGHDMGGHSGFVPAQYSARHSGSSGSAHRIVTPDSSANHLEPSRRHEAYGGRVESLGYGRKSSSLQRTFPIPEDMREFFADLERGGRTQVVQPVCQGDDPALIEYGRADGLCAGMVNEWFRLHSRHSADSASRRFGDTLNGGMDRLVALQDKSEARANKASKTSYKFVNPLTFLSSSSQEISNKMKKERREADAAGLSFRGEVRGSIDGRAGARAFARELLECMPRSGFYTIALESSTQGEGHVMGVRIPKGGGDIMMMDPNSAEVRTLSRNDLLDLLEKNTRFHRYHQNFDGFVVARFSEQ